MRQSWRLLPPLSVNYSDPERRNTLRRGRTTAASVIVAHQISSETSVRRSLLSTTCAKTQINVISARNSLYEAHFKAFASQPKIWQQQMKLRDCATLASLIVRKPELVSEPSKIQTIRR